MARNLLGISVEPAIAAPSSRVPCASQTIFQPARFRMPEGPSIAILRDQCQMFVGQRARVVGGNSRVIDIQRMDGKKVVAIRSWGKHFLVQFPDFFLRVHFLLFGSYRINERRQAAPRLSLGFDNGELNLYACSVKYVEGGIEETYDWSTDVLSPRWDPAAANDKLLALPQMLVCDALLDQSIFSGVGNIIKNEALFRIHMHPLSKIGALPTDQLHELIREARDYSFDFLKWKRAFVLKKHWQVHNQKTCPRCGIPLIRAHLGKHHRRTFYCESCQVLWDGPEQPPQLAQAAVGKKRKTAPRMA